MKVGSMLQGPIRSGSGIPQLEKKRYAKERELLSRMKRILKAGKEAGRIGEQHVSSQRKTARNSRYYEYLLQGGAAKVGIGVTSSECRGHQPPARNLPEQGRTLNFYGRT